MGNHRAEGSIVLESMVNKRFKSVYGIQRPNILHPVVLGNKLITKDDLTQLWFLNYIAVGQQSATCLDNSIKFTFL